MRIAQNAGGYLAFDLTWEEAVLWLRGKPQFRDLVHFCYYDDPLISAADRFLGSSEWRATALLLPEAMGGQALDLAAGRGIGSYALAKLGWGVCALEPDPSLLVGAGAVRELAKQTGLPIHVDVGYSETLPYGDCSFELVYCRQALHHAKDIRKTCKEIFRVLKPGGIIIATREHVLKKSEDLEIFLNNHPLHHLYGGENAYVLSEYTAAIERAGLQLKSILAPFDSPINYFPMTEEQWITHYTEPVAAVSNNTRKILFCRRGGLGHLTVPMLAKALNHFVYTPGQLYSFIAIKPC